MFKMVSIIPGIETGAPDLTDKRRGFSPPKDFPEAASTFLILFPISLLRPGLIFLFFIKETHSWVVIVKPGGTGIFRLHISAMFAPFPPRRSDIFLLPSTSFSEKKYIFCLLFIMNTF